MTKLSCYFDVRQSSSLAGEGDETLLAELDLAEVAEGLASFDNDGRYTRSDVFELAVDTRSKEGVNWSGQGHV